MKATTLCPPPAADAHDYLLSTEEERYEAFEAMRRLSEAVGENWKETAINISRLKPSDVEEFAALLLSELHIKNMWTVRNSIRGYP